VFYDSFVTHAGLHVYQEKLSPALRWIYFSSGVFSLAASVGGLFLFGLSAPVTLIGVSNIVIGGAATDWARNRTQPLQIVAVEHFSLSGR
jgi:hypothetical protein